MTTARLEAWADLLAARRDDVKPWVIVPLEPQRSDRHRFASYAELCAQAQQIAAALYARGAERGDRVAVIADNTLESALLMLGVLVSGLVLVPVAPRGLARRDDRWQAALAALCTDCDARMLAGRREALPKQAPRPQTVLCPVEELVTHEVGGAPASPAANDVALIQYTSGTTARARGVELTHANLLHNVRSIGEAIGANADDVGVLWLPLFHDMGLIGGLLFATYFGMSVVLMTPRAFLMRPQSWLWAIARFRATCSVAPNSAYQLCASKLADEKLAGLDLSSWRAAFTGAELVHSETVDGFSSRFARFGFREQAMLPVYGLAENTLATTFPPYGRGPCIDWIDRARLETDAVAHALEPGGDRPRRGVASLGSPLPGQQLRIVGGDPAHPLPERHVGRIEVRGACAMRGYHNAPAANAAVFTPDGWLRTGDRGYLAGGELHVVGRDKHIIKRGGRTYDGEEIERAVQSVAGVRGAVAAVFGLADPASGTETLIVLVECELHDRAERAALELAIAQRTQSTVDVRPDSVILLDAGTIPRTTSGKTRHDHARELYLEGRLQPHGPMQ